jgi:hypothetical protein
MCCNLYRAELRVQATPLLGTLAFGKHVEYNVGSNRTHIAAAGSSYVYQHVWSTQLKPEAEWRLRLRFRVQYRKKESRLHVSPVFSETRKLIYLLIILTTG